MAILLKCCQNNMFFVFLAPLHTLRNKINSCGLEVYNTIGTYDMYIDTHIVGGWMKTMLHYGCSYQLGLPRSYWLHKIYLNILL